MLFAIAYRMLGSASDAEDIVQECYLRYAQASATEIHSTKSYLTTIVTHLCLDSLKSARRQREQYVSVWLPEPILTTDLQEPVWHILEQHASISLAWYPGLHFSSAVVNRTAGILVWSKETLLAVIACEMTEEPITNLYEVINPDKLASIQRQMQLHA